MTHCGNCGIALVPGTKILVHTVTARGVDARYCVLGMSDGAGYTLADDDGALAVLCTDPDCDGEEKPWWQDVPAGDAQADGG